MDEYRNIIHQKITLLSNEKQLLFSLLICERLHTNYEFFTVKYNLQETNQLKTIIISLYENLLDGYSNENITEYITILDRITPDTENYDTIFVSFALDACTSVTSTLYYILDQNVDHIIDVATYARDTVDAYVREINALNDHKDLELLIDQDAIMINEKKIQYDVIEYLNQINLLNKAEIEKLRNIVITNTISLKLL